MNKKIAIILTLMMASTTSIMGCSSKVKVESDSIPDTVFSVSSEEDETESAAESEQSDDNKTQSTNSSETNSSTANSKTTQSTSSNQTSSNKSEANTKSTSSNTTASTKKAESTTKAKTGKAATFTAKAGYTLTFPANWEGKYEVIESPEKLTVNFKCSKDSNSYNPYLFSIVRVKEGEEFLEFDTVGDIRFFNVGDVKYCVGGPTGLTLDPSSKDFKEFEAINKQRADVVNSLKVIK